MAREARKYSDEFIKYQQFIISNPAYAGMPMPEGKKDGIPWVSPATSSLGKARTKWWDKQKADLVSRGLLKQDAKISDVARFIHPTKIKPCQTCGKYLSIEYVYFNSNAIKKINPYFSEIHTDEFTTLNECLDSIKVAYSKDGLLDFVNLFHLTPKSLSVFDIASEFSVKKIGLLSPGAMSNAPDRLDGFHSYNKCCRSKEDKGRSKENLMKYGEDRRAYENWADGDWKAASWLMKEFSKHNVSADHIGPISLGFCHTTFFAPMTKQENSAKNNRIRFEDVQKLLALEKDGYEIVSWHTKPVWDRLKLSIRNDADALELSKALRKHLHRVLLVLHELKIKGYVEFLESLLNPQYAFYSIKINGFDPETGKYKEIIKTKGSMTQYSRNSARYVRIAFDSLDQYQSKDNRKLADIPEKDICEIVLKTEQAIKSKEFKEAKLVLQDYLGGV
jgi:Alw26I/Eco31I/Esp3I family type II restriction endonuclease